MTRPMNQVRPMGGQSVEDFEQPTDRMGFRDMAKVIPEGEQGGAKVCHRLITEREATFSQMRQAAGNEQAVKAGTIAQLFVDGGLMMSDTPHERDSNWDLLRESRGDVLIAGLGLGMVLLPVLDEKRVKSLTVVEKSADVIALVEPHIRTAAKENANKLTVVQGDIFLWKAPRGARYNTIYFDIWKDIHRDNLKEIQTLHNRFRRRRATKSSWVSSWLYEELKDGWY